MKKIAIIGGGIAGVTAAYLFQERYQVTLFEKNDYLGGNNRSIDIGNGVKVPLVVIIFPRKQIFSHTINYAEKFRLKVKRRLIGHVFLKDGKVLFDSSTNPLSWIKNFQTAPSSTIIKDFFYMMARFKDLRSTRGKVIQDLIVEKKLSRDFVEYYLVPLTCLYLSMPYDEVFQLPLDILADWYCKYLLVPPWASMQFSFIEGGNHQLVSEFLKRTRLKVKARSRVSKILRHSRGVEVLDEGKNHSFDKVIMATPAHVSLSLLENPTDREKSLLGAIPYSEVTCTLHTDPGKGHRENIAMNVVSQNKGKREVVTTYSEDCFNYRLKKKHFVTIEPAGNSSISPEFIVHQENFIAPKTTAEALRKAGQLPGLNKNRLSTYYCGAYFGKYFYHEDAIESAVSIDEFDRRNF